MKKVIKITLIVIGGLAAAFVIIGGILLYLANEAIMSYDDTFYNNSGQPLEVRVIYHDRQDGDQFWKEKRFKLEVGETHTNHVRHVRFVPECIGITTEDSEHWLSASALVEVVNGEWHEIPSIRNYKITGEEAESSYCESKYNK